MRHVITRIMGKIKQMREFKWENYTQMQAFAYLF